MSETHNRQLQIMFYVVSQDEEISGEYLIQLLQSYGTSSLDIQPW